MIYTGDILIKQLDDDTWDIFFENGQPEMTNGFETLTTLAIFGEDNWQNGITKIESEKMKSKFPDIIKRAVVSDQTKNDGTKAIEEATAFFVSEKIAKSVEVTGEIFSAYGIQWIINIEALEDKSLKYYINWEKGVITAGFVKGV